ncbi:MAG TPA: DUF6600 domain-containing protein [Chthoniobacterales bacterium]|nr:DUF6600 domain-containing protein [Chthoniobacterales bacterium]
MKRFFAFSAIIALAALGSCQKQQTEAEKNAEVERQVQERLAAEHQAEQQQQLSQRQADLDAREKALAEKENPAAATSARRERSEAQPEPVTRPRAVSGARPTSGYSTFYTKLEPHGAWLETSDYGYVWQPREAESSRSWRPYTNGRWVYTDAGCTWISQEPFGWATYHYGRWTRLRGIGWVWVPGDQWAPAWVSWRKSNDYVGWAPLPPEARFDQRTGIHNWSDNYYDIGPDQYCFVPTREFGAQRIESTIVPPERNVTIVNQTTNVTNITYNNTTVVNEGPNYDEVRTQSREPMQRFRLERNVSVDVNVEAPRPLVQGETVIVAAPVIAAPQASERPRVVKQNITQVTVDLGWAAIGDHEAAKKTRDKMKSEATPPSNAPSKKFVKAAATTTTASQGSETPASSTSVAATPLPSATMSPTTAPSVAATSPPEPKMTPRRATPAEQSPTPAATSTPTSSASPLPTASQRRGRLLVPSATPPQRTTPSATPIPAASSSPTPTDTISSTQIPAPSASPASTGAAMQERSPQGKFKSQAQKFQPRRVEPMPSASPSSTVTSTSSPNVASTPSSSPNEKLTKQERKEQKREEKRELRRERREAAQQGEDASPSPWSTPE